MLMIQNELFLEQSLLSDSRLKPKQIAGAEIGSKMN